MRIILSLVLTLIGVLTIALGNGVFHYCISAGYSWTFSALSSWVIIFICTVLILWITIRSKERRLLHIIIGASLSIGLLVGNFIVRPIYQGDYTKKGQTVTINENSLLSIVLEKNPNYDGLICIASPSCPFCKEAAETRLKVMKERNPKLQIGIALFTSDSSHIEQFQSETETENLDYYLSPDEKGTIDLCHGAFPTFIYIKDKKILQIWTNGEMGYPALDWIENKLN